MRNDVRRSKRIPCAHAREAKKGPENAPGLIACRPCRNVPNGRPRKDGNIPLSEISRELETAKNQYDARDTNVASKTKTLAKAGVNIRTAERYEELAGGREEQRG